MIIIIFFALIILSCPVYAADSVINRFHSDIAIYEDSSFIVKETIEVEFFRPRHGIYREVPFKYIDELARTIKTPTRVISVTDSSGKEWKYKVSRTGNVVDIRIGDKNKYVRGKQTYVITYRVENAILFFNDHDELYWNVTGNYWKMPITDSSARITLATKKRSTKVWAACYTGIYGSRRSDCIFKEYESGIEFFARKSMNPGEGFTVAFGWDKKLINPPSLFKKFLWTIDIEENWVFLLPVFSLAFVIITWYRRGRDPRVREAVIVKYGPPEYKNIPLTPAEIGVIIDEKIDSRDITATIVGLAVKGYIKIEETKKEGWIFDKTDYYLTRIKDSDEYLSPFEIKLMSSIFSGITGKILVSDLKNKFYKSLQSLRETLNSELTKKGYFIKSPEKVKNNYIISGILIAVFGGVVYTIFTPFPDFKRIVAWILAGLPFVIFSKAMPAKTKAGAHAYMDILGFQDFLNYAEKDRLQKLGDINLFSKFLPYAIALDVVDNWAKAFEGIYQERPDWFVSTGGLRTFNPSAFTQSVDSVISNLASAMYSSPRGSGSGGGGGGFGGGGSSGGGFGGGGGGSW